jgi:hypothetical protein
MTNILIVTAFIICMALLFWLDRKGRNEKSEAERIYNEIFKIFNSVKWGMPLSEIREIFSEKEFVTSEESDKVMGTGYMDKLDDQDTFISFYFPKGGENRLVRTDFYLLGMSPKESALVFDRFLQNQGTPTVQNSAQQKSGSWYLGNSILTVDGSEEGELQIQLWNKEFYDKINENAKK